MIVNDLFESGYAGNTERAVSRRDLLKKNEGSLNEFAPDGSGGGGGNYLKALASAWYNDTFNTGSLHKGIKSQEDIERILDRGIHCGDGKVRKYSIGYNANFDGVEIQSHDHYEYSDYDNAGNDIDSRTGKPWGPYDVVEFSDNDLDESRQGVTEGFDVVSSYPNAVDFDYNGLEFEANKGKPGDHSIAGLSHDARNLLQNKQFVLLVQQWLDKYFSQGVAEGETPEKEIERLKLRQDAEHGKASLKRQAETQARIRELEKQNKNQGVAEGFSALLANATSRSDLQQIKKFVTEHVSDKNKQRQIMEQATKIVAVQRRQYAAKAAK